MPTSLQATVRQMLENYQRCGLTWIDKTGPLSPELINSLAGLVQHQQTSVDETNDTTRRVVDSGRQSTLPPSPPPSPPPSQQSQHSSPEKVRSSQPDAGQPQKSAASEQIAQPSGMVKTFSRSIPKLGDPGNWSSENLDDTLRQAQFSQLSKEVQSCRKCTEICNFRQQTVFGSGLIRPTVCFMGEAPGADEDRSGQPFVGEAGQMLTRIIIAMQLSREEVYILNALKCRPPGNRTPSSEEIVNCFPFVERQLQILQPKYIVCLGAVPARSLLKTNAPVGQLRGKFFPYEGARVLVTYHPSYLLRNESAKRFVWDDMRLLMKELGIPVTKKS